MKQIIHSTEAPQPIGPYSQAVSVGSLVFCSGQIALNPKTGELITSSIADETHQVMQNIQAVLASALLGMEHIVKTSIFLLDMAQFGSVNEVYASYFTGQYPARETVQVSGLPKGVNVEISVIALRPN